MCKFFSFVTEPDKHGGKRFYYGWRDRKIHVWSPDSHSAICKAFKIDEDRCNKYEYNFFTKKFTVDQINSEVDDRAQAHEWVSALDPKKVIGPMVVKDILDPFSIDVKEITDEHIHLFNSWILTYSNAGSDSFTIVDPEKRSFSIIVYGALYSSSIPVELHDALKEEVWKWYDQQDIIIDFGDMHNTISAYVSSFFEINYGVDFSPVVKLWEQGLVITKEEGVWKLYSNNGLMCSKTPAKQLELL